MRIFSHRAIRLLNDQISTAYLISDEIPSQSRSGSQWCEVVLGHQTDAVSLHDPQGRYLGILDSRTTKVLQSLNQQAFLKVEILVEQQTREVSINLYGQAKDSRFVGDALSQNDIHLQNPVQYDTSFNYKNPQNFQFSAQEKHLLPQSSEQPLILKHITSSTTAKILDVLLPQSSETISSGHIPGLDRLRTPLLAHQMVGVSFMLTRENMYNFSSPADPICTGGIIADEMGLGKTLTTLALICASIAQASSSEMETAHPLATLIVIPSAILSSWLEQIQLHIVPNALRVLKFHGSRRQADLASESTMDIVLTTYSTLVNDWRSKKSPLHNVHWARVVLDEAHFIKDRNTKRFGAVRALQTKKKWCLTGTPIQNSIEDIATLLNYLEVMPLDSFRQEIVVPLRNGEEEGLYTLQTLLRIVMLRRTKDIIDLPPREYVLLEVEASLEEREIYNIARDESVPLLMEALHSRNYDSGVRVLQSILRQRQICVHGSDMLPLEVRTRFERKLKTKSNFTSTEADETTLVFCERCNFDMGNDQNGPIFEFCFHLICSKCIPRDSQPAGGFQICPLCDDTSEHSKVVDKGLYSLQRWIDELNYTGPSSKIRTLIQVIKSSLQTSDLERKPKKQAKYPLDALLSG